MARDESRANAPQTEFDFQRLAEISGGDVEFEREVAAEYLAQARDLMATIARAISTHDPDAQRRAAHTLKGSSRTLGAVGVAELAAHLEKLGSDPDAGAAPEILGRASACLGTTERLLDRYFGSDEYRSAA